MDKFLNENMKYENNLISIGESFLQKKDMVLAEGVDGKPVTIGKINAIMEKHKVPTRLRAGCGLMLKNLWEYINYELSETTRMINIGTWDKFAYPMVTIVYPNLVAHELVSVQPMDGPTALIHYLKAKYTNSKGGVAAGDDMVTSPDANYASEVIEGEVFATGDGTAGPYVSTVQWPPIRVSTISLTDGTETFTDNGAGVLTGDAGGTGTVNYITGLISVTFNAAVGAGTSITVDYHYEQEGNSLVPEIDLGITQVPVTARRRSVMARWVLESALAMKKVWGLDGELEMVAAATSEIKFGLDQSIITDLWNGTTALKAAWPSASPTGVSYAEHQLSFIKHLNSMKNAIFKASGRGEGEWLVAGIDVATVAESLPGFEAAGGFTGRGVYKCGVLNGMWSIIKNSYFTDTNMLMGYRGSSMIDTGFVWSPYLLFFTTATMMFPDFINRKGFASMSGKKMIDKNFYCRGSMT